MARRHSRSIHRFPRQASSSSFEQMFALVDDLRQHHKQFARGNRRQQWLLGGSQQVTVADVRQAAEQQRKKAKGGDQTCQREHDQIPLQSRQFLDPQRAGRGRRQT